MLPLLEWELQPVEKQHTEFAVFRVEGVFRGDPCCTPERQGTLSISVVALSPPGGPLEPSSGSRKVQGENEGGICDSFPFPLPFPLLQLCFLCAWLSFCAELLCTLC